LQEQEEYMEIRDKLKNLPKIKSDDNFEIMLQQKINLAEAEMQTISEKQNYSTDEKKSFFKKIFTRKTNYWLIPALGTVVIILIIVTIYYPYKKTELIPNAPVSQTLSDKVSDSPNVSRQTTIEEKKIENKLAEKNTTSEQSSDVPPKDIKNLDGYYRGGIEKELSQPTPVTPMKSDELRIQKNDDIETINAPSIEEQQKIESKSKESEQKDSRIIESKKEEERKGGDLSIEKSAPANKDEVGKSGKLKGAKEYKKSDKKNNRAVTDSTKTNEDDLEIIRNEILEKEKNK